MSLRFSDFLKAAARWLLCLLLCTRLPAQAAQPAETAGEHALPLPRWSEQELQTFRNNLPGVTTSGALLPGEGQAADLNDLIHSPLPSSPRLDSFFDGHQSEISPRLQVEDLRRFLPEALLRQPAQTQAEPVQLPTPLASLREVSAEFLAACTRSLPKEYLIDPDQYVPEVQSHDMQRLLEFHAQDARIKLFVLVTAHDQKLPEKAELEKIASGSLLQSDACLLVYPLGEPWRTRLFVSRSIHNQISTAFLSETIHACLQESLQSSNVHDQLRRYTIHLSTRLFWLQKALSAQPGSTTDESQSLTEFTSVSEKTTTSARPAFISLTVYSAAGLLVLGLTVISGRRLLHHRRLRHRRQVWTLSEPETVPRLGGAFTGGGGGMIRYA